MTEFRTITPVTGSAAEAAARESLRWAVECLREWKMFRDTRRQFRIFLIAIGLGALVICGAITLALTQVDTGAPITKPTPVIVSLGPSGAAALTDALGCESLTATDFYAVAGTWGSPVIAASGPGCVVSARWMPTPAQAFVAP